jgi:LPS-assembly protein
MNDVDYLNLSSNDTISNVTSNQIYSRVNLFYNEESNYYGSYIKYYLDLDPQNTSKRRSTIQKLPILQYHHYLDAFLEQHLYYDLNMNATNYSRPEGKKGEEVDVSLPIALQTSLFGEYLNVAYKAKLQGRIIDFRGEPDVNVSESIYEQGYYGSVSHEFSAGSYVTKAYEEYSHSMGLSATYTKFGTDKKTGYYDTVENNCTAGTSTALECEFYTLNNVADNVDFQFTQYIMDSSGKEKLYHRLSQPLIVQSGVDIKTGLGDFENEFRWSITDRISFYDNSFYSFARSEWVKTLNTIRYTDPSFNVGLTYLYENNPNKSVEQIYTNYLNADLSYRYDEHYKYFTKYALDVENNLKKYAEIGFLYSKRCWDFGLRYVENNRPVLTQGGETKSVYDKYVYFTINMKPLGGSEVNYRTTDTLNSR